MAKCFRCGKSGLMLKLDARGYCPECVLSTSQQESERILQSAMDEKARIQREAEAEAQRVIDAARADAERIVDAARAEHDRILGSVSSDLAKAQAELARIRQNSSAAIGTANAQLAALFESAGKDFAFAARTSAVRDLGKRKLMTLSQFKKAAKDGYVLFDLETTGLNRSIDRIIEYGAIRYDGDGVEVERFHALVNPGMKIPAASTAIHGINDSMIANAPTTSEMLPAFAAFLAGCTCVAHNAPFDLSFIEAEAERCGQSLDIQCFDTLPACRKAYMLPNHRLGTIARHLGFRPDDAHRSLADCEALNVIVRDLLSR